VPVLMYRSEILTLTLSDVWFENIDHKGVWYMVRIYWP